MAAKTLKEAVALGICSARAGKGVEPAIDQITKELRDFFAHEVMRMEGRHGLGMPNQLTAKDLFDKVFSDIPAFNK